jgi:ribonuclease G
MFGWFKRDTPKRLIIVNAESLETRVAVMENGSLEELQIEHPTEERIVGSIYKGKIQNLEHDLQAAFVDIGLKKNAFLHYWDMIPDDDARLDFEDEGQHRGRNSRRRRFSNSEIEKRFPPGAEIIVQVTKGPIGTKGPRVTATLSIPGRYLVMMPGTSLRGVSRKIGDDKERQRLKKIMLRLPLAQDTGLIARTVASGASKLSLIRDLRSLVSVLADLNRAIAEKAAPCCIYREPDIIERVVRDWLTEDIDSIIVDSPEEYERIRDIAAKVSRRAKGKISHYEGELPVFEHYEVERQIEEAFRRTVHLKSGGYVVFDETEALIAIDVNTGRHKGEGSQEDAIVAVNTEAAAEIARQLRLRNIGGLVVIDFIDMKSRKHQSAVFKTMKAALKRDRARTNILQISELGIMEMTRQRVEESILSLVYVDCPYCRGRGHIKSPMGMSVDIQRQISAVIRKQKSSGGVRELQVVVHPTVLERLRSEDEEMLVDLESKFQGRLNFKSDPTKHVEYFSINDVTTGEILYSVAEK